MTWLKILCRVSSAKTKQSKMKTFVSSFPFQYTGNNIYNSLLLFAACEGVDCGPGTCRLATDTVYLCICNDGSTNVNSPCPASTLCGNTACREEQVCVDMVCECPDVIPSSKLLWCSILACPVFRYLHTSKCKHLHHSCMPPGLCSTC